MTQATIGVALASVNEGDLLEACLPTVSDFDEVIVLDLESSDATSEVAHRHGAIVKRHARPAYIERIRGEQLVMAATDWVLLLDPDERVPDGWLKAVRQLIEETSEDVSGYWIRYREIAFGVPLEHTRVGAAKISLVRTRHARGQDPRTVLPHEALSFSGIVAQVPDDLPLIDHVGYRSVDLAIQKLVRYASHGGVGSAVEGELGPLTGIKMLWGSVVMTGSYKDGPAGVAVASMSAIGDYMGLLTRWERQGRPATALSIRQRLMLDLARSLHRFQWTGRRAVRAGMRRWRP